MSVFIFDHSISFIVVNYNSGELLQRTVASILNSSYPASKIEVIIVDNASKDNSVELLQSMLNARSHTFNNLIMIRNEQNEGWCRAINKGLTKASGDVVVFSNHDVIYSENSISTVVAQLMSRKDVGICQFNSLSPSGEPDVAAAYLDPLGYAYSFLTLEPTLVSFGEAVAIAIKKEVFKKIGRLDEDYFIEYEDQDFCWRALLYGFKVLFIPDAVVQHYRGSVEKADFFARRHRGYLYTRNHICTLIKNLEIANLFYYLPQVLLIESCKAAYILVVKRNPGFAWQIFKGILAPLSLLPSLLEKRKKIQKNRTIPDRVVLKSFVPFMPMHQINFIRYQKMGKRYVLNNEVLLQVLANRSAS
ncbi:MAG: glycosyltransferase family 2 protein [Nitrososphaera sp.]